MTPTFDLILDSALRHVRANSEDVAAWGRLNGVDVDRAAPHVADMVARVTSLHRSMDGLDRAFRREATDGKTDRAELAKRADFIRNALSAYVGLADSTLQAASQLPADARPPLSELADLRRHRDEAAELAGVYEGEASFFRGDPGTSWEEARKMLGV
jgi:hypothetical protein